MLNYVVQFSGGLSSWMAAERIAKQIQPGDTLRLLFCDTLIEDEDCYRFMIEAAAHVSGVELAAVKGLAEKALRLPTLECGGDLDARKAAIYSLRSEVVAQLPALRWLIEGRTPWEVFQDKRFLGNSRFDPCSAILKRELGDRWVTANTDRSTVVRVFGLAWHEPHRIDRIRSGLAAKGWMTAFPLDEEPLLSPNDLVAAALRVGIQPPRLYAMGFTHNNCGGYCCKMGQASAARLLHKMPERYAYHEAREEEIRGLLGNVASLTDRRGGKKKPLSLQQFRGRLEAGMLFDETDGGACSCFVEAESVA